MKILHINQNFHGNPLHRRLFESLNANGIDSTMVCFKRQGWLEPNGEKDFTIPVLSKWDRIFFMWKHHKCLKAINELIREGKIKIREYDLIYAHTLFSDGSIAYELSQKYKIPYIVEFENTDINSHYRYRIHLRGLARRVIESASKIFSFSYPYRDQLLKKCVSKEDYDRVARKVCIMPPGLTSLWMSNFYKNREFRDDNRIRIAAVGVALPNKNHIAIIKAAEILKKRGYEVSIDVASHRETEKIVNLLKSKELVTYHGKLTQENIMKLYRFCDVFALASFVESFGMVYVEALSQGLPIVYTRGQGVDGHFQDGEVGFSVCPYDISEIADKIELAFQRRRLLYPICLKRAEEFDWNKIVARHKVVYDEIVTRNRYGNYSFK